MEPIQYYHDMNPSFYLKQMELGPMENYVYLVGDRNSREVLVVDPAWNVDAIFQAARKDEMNVRGALITHTHFDHVNGLEALLQKTDGVVYIHQNEANALKGMQSNVKKISGGENIKIGAVEITFLHTPGHTPGSQCFLVESNLISGDTLFINACGRCDLPGGNPEQMYESLTRLADLDDSVVLYPGHNYAESPTSTIGEEKRSNPYMQSGNLQDFLKYRMGY